ncbi:MAG: Na(+)-translocating NADH-quinone reductase subunit A [bacterium]|nr:Na(+)-translocating NADH-quinone reductase subunit A [Candidatus Minthenecus merdequi]
MNTIKIKRGLDIKIGGKAEERLSQTIMSKEIAIVPDQYVGLAPKLAVKEGDQVSIGTPVLFDKNHPALKVVSPVCGQVKSVVRGERRKLLSIVIERNDAAEQRADMPSLNTKSADETIAVLCELGFSALIHQRPYDVVANPEVMPKAIFVSAFNTAPLGADYNFVYKDEAANIQAGLDVLVRIAKTYYSIAPSTCSELRNMKGVEVNEFAGVHPASNVGVHINHLNPVNKGEVVWTVPMFAVALIGRYANTGKSDWMQTIAVAGPKVKTPCYVKAIGCCQIGSIVKDNINADENIRIINGNVLTGLKATNEDFLSPMADCVNVIAEGDHEDELFGWMMPRFNKFSASRLYCSRLLSCLSPKKTYRFDARMLGSERAFIMSGEYDKVFPMDIFPEQLCKAMITRNIDKMEQLGAYEVAPEDFALCEFVCTSKIETQKIVREALDFMRKELE